jgi:hypothetical protein
VATPSANLIAARDNLEQLVADQTAAWVAAGCPPTYSVDGESEDWNNWLAGKIDALEKLNELVRVARPFIVRSRLRG